MSQGTATTAVDVVIVNWNTAEAAIEAAKAYLRSDSVEARVTVVDNASQPEQQQLLEEGCPEEVRLVPQGEGASAMGGQPISPSATGPPS